MSELIITDLHARAEEKEILSGVNLTILSGKYMRSWDQTVRQINTRTYSYGRPGYEITQGNIMLNGEDITNKPTWQRAQLGLSLAMQYPVEIDGVTLLDLLNESSLIFPTSMN